MMLAPWLLRWFNVIGLGLDFAGAVIITLGVIATRKHIDEITTSKYGHNPAEREDRRRQSNLAIVGLALLLSGFLLQIIGSWPR